VICAINPDSMAHQRRNLSAPLLKGALRETPMARWLPLAFPQRHTDGTTSAKARAMFSSMGGCKVKQKISSRPRSRQKLPEPFDTMLNAMRILSTLADECADDKKQYVHFIRAAAAVAKDCACFVHPRLAVVERPAGGHKVRRSAARTDRLNGSRATQSPVRPGDDATNTRNYPAGVLLPGLKVRMFSSDGTDPGLLLVRFRKGWLMTRVERGAEIGPRILEYSVRGYPNICGRSRQPLLDACGQLKSTGGLTDHRAGVFRGGSEVADISCVVRAGAELTDSEPSGVGKARFVKYGALDAASVLEAA
jgi:hypothetical protein